VAILVAIAVVGGVVLRFWTRSPLWLDEALSVNIARLPIGKIGGQLRHDGHPPLFYVLLHGWMGVFGHGNRAVRAFSGVWALGVFPLLWVAAKRLGGVRIATYAIVLLALSPFAVRYGTETRMYAMEMVLALGGWLLVDDAVRSPRWWRLAAIAAIVATLLWTHYWAMWFLATVGIALLIRAWRARKAGNDARLRACLTVVGAMVVGGLAFLPWVPTLLYQGAHTGTPWARPLRPTEMIAFTLADLGGGPKAESIILGWSIAGLAVLGLCGRAIDTRRIELDVRTQRAGRPFVVLVAGTLGLACVVGYATGATYATRYAAIFVPFIYLLAALGLDQIRSRPIAVGALAFLVVFGGFGSIRNVVQDRSDAAQSARAINARGSKGDLVVYCPDQLGPATSRLLGAQFDQVTYPAFKSPQFVDWVDYKKRLDEANPKAFADEVLKRAGSHRVFFVFFTGYTTHKKSCTEIYNAMGKVRPPEILAEPSEAFEPATVAMFAPVPPAPAKP
jgi:uncharacterized membrane protein